MYIFSLYIYLKFLHIQQTFLKFLNINERRTRAYRLFCIFELLKINEMI